MKIEQVVLQGNLVRLEPMEAGHLDAMWEAGREPGLWRWTVSRIAAREDMQRYLETALDERERGVSLPFVKDCRLDQVRE